MAKNRVNQSAAIRFGPAIKAFLLCMLIGGAGISYVWQKKQVFDLGRRVSGLEQHLNKLRKDNQLRRRQLDQLHLPGSLARRARDLNLTPATAGQVKLLPEPHPEPLVSPRTSGVYASDHARALMP